jgi:pyrroloquinoline quinone biosynthesis protein D
MESVPRLNRLYKLQFEKAQNAHVLLFPEGMITLNPSAAEILLQVDNIKNQGEIIAILKDKYPEAVGIAQDVNEFLQVAAEKDWIHYE